MDNFTAFGKKFKERKIVETQINSPYFFGIFHIIFVHRAINMFQ